VQQEVVLAMLAKEPTYGYELRARLRQALGPVGEDLNAGQIYVTLTRLEKAGLVTATAEAGQERPDRKVYELTATGQQRVAAWLAEVSWPRAPGCAADSPRSGRSVTRLHSTAGAQRAREPSLAVCGGRPWGRMSPVDPAVSGV
jgi:DNA-binding PadR family transcriptional regulator